MGKVEAIKVQNDRVDFLGQMIVYPSVIETRIELQKVDGTAKILITLPHYYKNREYANEFLISLDIIVDTENEEANQVCYQILAELKKAYNFKSSDVTRSIVPSVRIGLVNIPANKLDNLALVERECNKIINILKKY